MRPVAAIVAAIMVLIAVTTAPPTGPAAATPTAAAAPTLVDDPVGLVDPFVGTTGGTTFGGHTTPAATVPFGMVQFGPDTTSRPAGGGYEYGDRAISGFSLTHLSGPGCPAFGDVPLLPIVGSIDETGIGGVPLGSTTQPFTHDTEQATPGSYGVTVGAPGIRAELAAAPRAGLATFAFPPTDAANILVKAGSSAEGADGVVAVVLGNDAILTATRSGHFCGSSSTYVLFSVIEFSRPFISFGSWNGSGTHVGNRVLWGTEGGAYATFDTRSSASVTARVGISYVGITGARANIRAEVPAWDLAEVRAAAQAAWNDRLGRIQIGGGTDAQQRTFYTALYHSLLHPNLFSDADGSYIGFDGQVHTSAAAAHYANISGWDVYRTQIPLLAWIAPDVASAVAQSMIDDAHQNGGRLPKWSLANAETYTMVGDPAAPIIASVAAFGARGFSMDEALQLLVEQATVPNDVRPGLEAYLTYGSIPVDATIGCCSFSGPVSTTLEYATADFAIGRLAALNGDAATAMAFTDRAGAWTNVWQARDGLPQQKYASGQFLAGPNPTTQYGFVEGNALQYAWAVPHDLGAVISAVGGREAAVARLDDLFGQLNTGPNAPSAFLGNEPSFATPYAYVNAGAPARTHDVIARIRAELFADAPSGLPGNDDLGATSAWYVWSALGLYPSVPGTADLILGSPLFPTAVVHAGLGSTLTINAPSTSSSNRYVAGLAIDGAASTRSWLPAGTILGGGTLDLTMSPTPSASFGTSPADAPPSYPARGASVVGYSEPSGSLAVPPGSVRELSIGAVDLTATGEQVDWTVAVRPVAVGPSPPIWVGARSGSFVVPPSGRAERSLPLVAPATGGVWEVRFTFSAAGRSIAPVVVRVTVAAPGDLGPHADNTGISDDANLPAASFDHSNFSYSRQALAGVGLAPGATVAVGPFSYQWPAATGGTPDNVIAAGQEIDLVPRPGTTQIGVLASATNAGAGAEGSATITYTDGTSSSEPIGVSDWTLGAGTVPVGFGNEVVASTPYLNCQCGARFPITAYVFQATIPVDPARTVASIRLPSRVSSGDLHVFAVALA